MPSPDRAAKTGRAVIACVITMLLVLLFQLPNGFLAVFYVMALSRDTPQSVIRNGFALLLGNLAGLALALAGIVLFIDYPLLHFIFALTTFFLAFYAMRTLSNYNLAFGFSIILVAATSVNIIWARPAPLRPDIGITIWTAFGMALGTVVTVLIDWLFQFGGKAAPQAGAAPWRLFVPDAFSNPQNVRFALKGCLAAAICYIVWSAIDWPGLGVCTVTCVIAAPLTTPGTASRRLFTRIAGLLFGGVICGIGTQILIRPEIDSLVGFTLAFALISAAAAWASTSSAQFSVFGRQMALACYLTLFQGFGIGASLATSRDRLMGILLGLLSMWLVFDVTTGLQPWPMHPPENIPGPAPQREP